MSRRSSTIPIPCSWRGSATIGQQRATTIGSGLEAWFSTGTGGRIAGIDFGYLDFVNATVADCIDEAAANLEPARVKFATTDSIGLSLGLDVEDDGQGVADGKVLVDDDLIAPETDGRIVDSRLSIMQVTRRGRPTRCWQPW